MRSALQRELKQNRPYDTAEEEAAVALARTAALLEHAAAELLRPHGITTTQYNVLRILRGAQPDGLCRNEVRDRLLAPVPDATRLLDRMVDLALVSRDRDTPDRRYVTTRITARGLDLLERLDEPINAFHRKHFGALDEATIQQLIQTLAAVRATVL